MADKEVKKLVKEITGGYLSAIIPLMDRLEEVNDPRGKTTLSAVGELYRSISAIETRYFSRPSRRSPEEHAFRKDNACFELWVSFMHEFESVFWQELNEKPLIDIVKKMESYLQTKKQEQRRSQTSSMDEVTDEPYEGEMGMNKSASSQFFGNT
jgi:hypothetical protein